MKFCAPAVVYLVLAIIALVLNMRFSMVSILLHVAFIGLWTFILNWICSKGLKWVSWVLVVLPYLFAALVWLIGVEIMAINGMEGFERGGNWERPTPDNVWERSTTKPPTTKPTTTKPTTTKPRKLIIITEKPKPTTIPPTTIPTTSVTLKPKLKNLDNLTYEQITELTSSDIDYESMVSILNKNNYVDNNDSVKVLMIDLYQMMDAFNTKQDGTNKYPYDSYLYSKFYKAYFDYFTEKFEAINFTNINPDTIKYISPYYFGFIPQNKLNTLTSDQISNLTLDQKEFIRYAGNTLPGTTSPTR